jgi:signal peptidase I
MNFALILFVLLVVSGLVTLADKLVFARRRRRAADRALAELDERYHKAPVTDEMSVLKERGALEDRILKEPWWIEYSKSFFPVIVAVFLLRSFLVEPFKIPSGSMIPTLLVGDFILVNKYAYGIRLPIINKKIIEVGNPERGDVMVFRYPLDPSLDFIKRVVGLPGDRIRYSGKRLWVNDKELPLEPLGDYINPERVSVVQQYIETINGHRHRIIVENDAPALPPFVHQFPYRENCTYNNAGLACTVPPGHYFLMGDNRDNSSDSRVWGFVPDANIVGKAFFIWLNFGELGRFGRFR